MGAMAAISAVGMVAGSAMSAYGQISAGGDAKKLAGMNAQVAEWQAQDALKRGKTMETRQRRQTEQVIGAQRAGLGMQGVDVNKGSAVDVQADAAYLGELDALTIRENAAKEAWGYRVAATNSTYQGQMAQQAGYFGAFNTILGSSKSLLLAKYSGGYAGGGVKHSTSVPLDFDPSRAGR